MDKSTVSKTLKQLKANSPKKNFKQSIDLIINLKDLDLKKPEQQVNLFVTLHYSTGKESSVCAFVGPELEKSAKETCNEIILAESFPRFKDKKDIKKLASKYDFFLSQANIMPQVATVFGRFLGPRGKMPNPKAGAVLPPNANLAPLVERLKRTLLVATRNEPVIKCMVGKEDLDEEKLIDNILTVYNSVLQKLPSEKHNIKSVMLKLTMGPSFTIGQENAEAESHGKKKPKKAKKAAKKPEQKEPASEKTQSE